MNLSQKGVGGVMLATAAGRIDLSNADAPIFQTTREAVVKLAPDALAEFDAG